MPFLAAPHPVRLTHEQAVAFRDLCASTQSNDKEVAHNAVQALKGLPPERARALLLHLWAQDEPDRRKWAARGNAAIQTSLFVWLGGGMLLLVWAAIAYFSHRVSFPNFLWLNLVGSGCNVIANAFWNKAPAAEQRGSVQVLMAHPSSELCGPLVDAYSFRNRWGMLPTHVAVRAALADVLPQFTPSDAPPLDTYQRRVLRNEVRRYARRLHKPDASLADDETAFLRAAIGYLAVTPEPRQEGKRGEHDTRQTKSVVQRLSDLSHDMTEGGNRRTVRETAQACLLLMQTGRQG